MGVAAATDDQVHPVEVALEWVAAAPRAALRTVTLDAHGRRPGRSRRRLCGRALWTARPEVGSATAVMVRSCCIAEPCSLRRATGCSATRLRREELGAARPPSARRAARNPAHQRFGQLQVQHRTDRLRGCLRA